MGDLAKIKERMFELSASDKSEELIELVRRHNFDVNSTNDRGWTPLHFACRFGHLNTVNALIQLGAKLHLLDKEGKSPQDMAMFWGHEHISSALKSSEVPPSKLQPAVSNFFSGNDLNRMSGKRSDLEWISKHLTDSSTVFMVFSGSKNLIKENKEEKTTQIAWLNYKSVQRLIEQGSLYVFLGLREPEGLACFALDITPIIEKGDKSEEEIEKQIENENENTSFKGIRPSAFFLASGQAGIIAQGRSILDWNLRNRFCPICGNKTESKDAGYKRVCPKSDCKANEGVQNVTYPRLDPVVIVLVLSQDHNRILLGRSSRFPTGMYSCLAGFMEPGESIEEAARREVFEESGVKVGTVIFHSNQPWPFPSQLMIGCIGEAISEEIIVDKEELEDAKWFTKDEILKSIDIPVESRLPGTKLPPKYAIAHQLIRSWAEGSLQKSKI